MTQPVDFPPPPVAKAKMALWKKALLALTAIVVLFLSAVALQPADFRVERGVLIGAPAESAFLQVNDFHLWQDWSPWAKRDPQVKNSFEGPASGAGAVFHWSGNAQVGEGTMTIVESKPHDLIRIRLEFTRPFECDNAVEFRFEPEGESARVRWSMAGRNNFFGRAICLLTTMDRLVGADFEKGLEQLKVVAEATARQR
jgi:hypothetical protein